MDSRRLTNTGDGALIFFFLKKKQPTVTVLSANADSEVSLSPHNEMWELGVSKTK